MTRASLAIAASAALVLLCLPGTAVADPTDPVDVTIGVPWSFESGRTYLLKDVTTPEVLLLPVPLPPIVTPNVPGTPGIDLDRFDVPPGPPVVTPDVPATPGLVTDDFPGTPATPTPEVDVDGLTITTFQQGDNLCFGLFVLGDHVDDLCVDEDLTAGAGDALPDEVSLVTVPSVTVPPVPGQPVPDVPATPGVPVPDYGGTPAVDFNDVRPQPERPVPDYGGSQPGEVAEMPAWHFSLYVDFDYECEVLDDWASVGPNDVYGPFQPGAPGAEWLATNGADAGLTVGIALSNDDGTHLDGGEFGEVPFLGQMWAWALYAASGGAGCP